MDTNQHSPAFILHTWLASLTVTPAPAALYYHLTPEGSGVGIQAITISNSSGITQRAARGPQYTQYGIQILGRGADIAEARKLLAWATDAVMVITPKTPVSVTIEGQLYLLSSVARFGTIAELGQTEKHRYSTAIQDYRVTILKG